MATVSSNSPQDRLQPLAARARALVERADHAAAIELIDQELANVDESQRVDAMYVLAVACRLSDQADRAKLTLTQLISQEPSYARAHQELGHIRMAADELPAAQQSYERAVSHNRGLVASWKALLNLYALHDADDNPSIAARQQLASEELRYLLALPKPLLGAVGLLEDGKLYEADQVCRQFLRSNKQHIEGMRLLARVGAELNVLTDAEFLLETALALRPGHVRCLYDLTNLQLRMQKFDQACHNAQILTEADPGNLSYRALLANAYAGVGRSADAVQIYDDVIEQSEGQTALMVMRGHALKAIGQTDRAVLSYRQAYHANPRYGDAYWSLANTKTYQFDPAEVDQMAKAESHSGTTLEDRIHLCFALGKAMADQRRYEAAFTYFDRGNSLKHASTTHRAEYLTIRATRQAEVCKQELFAANQASGDPAPDPIFIVGLPRAGSTLIEQILASHSQIDGTHELPNIIALAQKLRAGRKDQYPHVLAELDPSYFRRFGEQFIEETRVFRSGAPRFIDKNPNNFFHIGLIKLMLPNAKIIDARRHPMSCCWSGFKQLFGQGQEFSYNLETIGNYYREYVGLMDHWDRVLPEAVLRVQHEELVDDLEFHVRRMLDYLGLDFEPACLEFHRTERSVRTPSSEQVRQPVNRRAFEEWRDYEPWLSPLKAALGADILDRYGVSP